MKTNEMKSTIYSNKGLTLVELLGVIVILGILAAIAVPSVMWLIEKSREDVCEVNRLEIERMYLMGTSIEGQFPSSIDFKAFLLDYGREICPSGGEISYVDGEVKCSVHGESKGEHDQPDEGGGEVPFL